MKKVFYGLFLFGMMVGCSGELKASQSDNRRWKIIINNADPSEKGRASSRLKEKRR